MRTWPPLEKLVERIERASVLDRPAGWLSSAVRKVIPSGVAEDLLSGTTLGHPLHPLLVAVPIGAWSAVPLMDVVGETEAARRLTGLGCLAALPTAAAGSTDWLATRGAERRVGLVHALLNSLALTTYLYSWRARRHGRHGVGAATGLAGAAFLGVAGYLGGHLTYAQGVGVDTTAFLKVPTEWTDVGAVTDLPDDGHIARMTATDAPLLVTRRGQRVVAMLDRCTHRGGPLSEGSVSDGCVTCPWHGSSFSLDDGTVRSGPASRQQPTFETRLRDGRLEVRRHEPRTLRTNPTGP